jgi:hypothetical protein
MRALLTTFGIDTSALGREGPVHGKKEGCDKEKGASGAQEREAEWLQRSFQLEQVWGLEFGFGVGVYKAG